MEAEVVFGALCRRVAGFELAGTPVYKRNNTLRGFEHLPVRLRLD
jgi:cytochrome P450